MLINDDGGLVIVVLEQKDFDYVEARCMKAIDVLYIPESLKKYWNEENEFYKAILPCLIPREAVIVWLRHT